MKAWRYQKFGGPEVLELGTAPKPAPAEGELLVRGLYAALSPFDAQLAAGGARHLTHPKLPFTPGCDFCGVVEGAGLGCGEFPLGSIIHAHLLPRLGGACAEHAVVPVAHAVAAPDGVRVEEAAALPTSGLAALQALRDHGRVEAGSRVLVVGAGGSVGQLAVQLALALGAEVTAVTAEANLHHVEGLGPHHLAQREMLPSLLGATGAYDCILDTAGVVTYAAAKNALARTGTLVGLVPTPSSKMDQFATALGPRRYRLLAVEPSHEDLTYLGKLLSLGVLRLELAEVVPFVKLRDAFKRLAEPGRRGKLVLRLPGA